MDTSLSLLSCVLFSALASASIIYLEIFELMIVPTRHLLCVRTALLLRLAVLIEITRVGRMSQFRYDGPFDFAVVERVPVDGGEERVRFNPVNATCEVSKALRRVDGAETGDEGASVGIEVGREFDLAYANSIARY